MQLFKKSRAINRPDISAETAEIKRILRKGPNDGPAGIRHNHVLLRSVGKW